MTTENKGFLSNLKKKKKAHTKETAARQDYTTTKASAHKRCHRQRGLQRGRAQPCAAGETPGQLQIKWLTTSSVLGGTPSSDAGFTVTLLSSEK